MAARYGEIRYAESRYAPGAAIAVLVPVYIDYRSIAPVIFDTRTLSMPKHGVFIDNLVVGDDWRIKRTYSDLDSGLTFSKWYFTLKSNANEIDATAEVQVSITSVLGANGQITDAATTGGTVAGYFDIADTLTDDLIADQRYYYDIQGITDAGAIYTFETGIIQPRRGFTFATT